MVVRPLIHLGYHKTATTWFQKNLWNNRGFGFASGLLGDEEQDYFRVPAPFDFDAAQTARRLRELFSQRVPAGYVPTLSCETFSGSFLAGGHDARQNADRLKATLPDARIVVCVREQKSAILSAWRQYVREGGQCPLKRFLRPQSILGLTFPQFRREHFAYDRLVSYYQTLFGHENVHVGIFEEFKASPETFLAKLMTFVHGPGHPYTDFDQLPLDKLDNVMLSRLSLILKRRLNLISAGRHGIASWTLVEPEQAGHRLTVGLFNPTYKIISRLTPARLDQWLTRRDQDHVARFVGDWYHESNARLSQLIGEDLSRWKYQTGSALIAGKLTASDSETAAEKESRSLRLA